MKGKKPVATGYRSSFAFNSLQHFSGEVKLLKSQELKPGNSRRAKIKLLPSRYIRRNLKPSDAFTINEGNKTIGIGIIEKVQVVEYIQ